LLLSQQPCGQDVALQMQSPVLALHCVPGAQITQAFPPKPQSVVRGGLTQAAPSQHPAQLVELQFEEAWHEPPLQVLSRPHARHSAPPVPHAVAALPGWH
jgi:hypothetical protein